MDCEADPRENARTNYTVLLWSWRKHWQSAQRSDILVPTKKGVPEQIPSLIEEMYNGATTRVRTECGASAEFAVSGVTPGVSTEPFPVCGSARCVKRKCQERKITGATVCR